MKDLATCTGISVAQAIYDIFDHFKVNSEQCFVCISDNTNYMSGKSGGAISLFNKQKVAFGKLPNVSGFSQKELPANGNSIFADVIKNNLITY
ncbi:unnamed protein product [Rhizophagus irregularis]|uniref:Uncharacterized protein n=1 Tax=Rhizophagus irregularis TaxID=588596 RepID=A0A2N1MEN9_9GLOM|nr:hypothetical protein RhiirC2_793832 [Rhizophagus irregularis]CAB5317701.1 unnamed protein product [Rhizophagus irregularis]